MQHDGKVEFSSKQEFQLQYIFSKDADIICFKLSEFNSVYNIFLFYIVQNVMFCCCC